MKKVVAYRPKDIVDFSELSTKKIYIAKSDNDERMIELLHATEYGKQNGENKYLGYMWLSLYEGCHGINGAIGGDRIYPFETIEDAIINRSSSNMKIYEFDDLVDFSKWYLRFKGEMWNERSY